MKSAKPDNITCLDESLEASKIAIRYSFIFSFFANLLMLLVPTYSMQVLDRVISSGSIETLIMLTIVTFFAILGYTLISNARANMMMDLGHWLDKSTAPVIFTKLIESSAQGRKSEGNQAMADFSVVKNFIIGPILSTLIDAPWAIIFMIVLFIIHPIIGTATLVWGIILLVLAIFNENATKPSSDAASAKMVKAARHVEASTRNAEVIEAMGMAQNILHTWGDHNKSSSNMQMKAGKTSGAFGSISKFMRLLAQISITGFGGFLVLEHSMTTGGMIAAAILAGKALAPFESAITSWKGVLSARKSHERLSKILSDAPDRPENINLPQPRGQVVFDKVFFAPAGNTKPSIKGISFTIEPGEILGVIGPSAAGKSTIAKLITGVLKPNSGAVRLDGADVYYWKRDNFGKYVGYLPQDVELFAGTVKDNIARMDKNADDKDVVAAAADADAHKMILALPHGYATEIGDGGAMLSAGQRQRIGLARAFYGTPKLIVLDEPNSNLDGDGELALANALKNAKKNGSTVVIISHKPAIVALTDKILIIKDGSVAAFGPSKEVLEKVGGNNAKK
jgi:PrtD family type I secretion system ABC transporter